MKIEITGNLIALVFVIGVLIIAFIWVVHLITREEKEKEDLNCNCDLDPLQCAKYCIWKRNMEGEL